MSDTTSTVTVDAQPEPLSFAPEHAALLVVDMQNDFGADGGMFARAGLPIDGIKAVVTPIARVLDEARKLGMTVVYLKMQFEPDLSNAGGSGAPNLVRHQHFGLGESIAAPDGTAGRILIRNTWNTDIVQELAPRPDDVIVGKHRFSGFYDTELDAILRQRGVDTLIVTGCTTSICVESTIRDAFYRDYRCLLLADCTAEPLGGEHARTNHDASLLNIQALFGWVSDSVALIDTLATSAAVTQS
jgi:ureidoacrylate peracid hydrolase